MLAENETIGWHPEHIKHGRFGKWLEGNVDWALSRERYWGTPLPIWECQADGLRGALLRRLDRRPARARRRRPRRPPPPATSTRSTLRCEACGGEMRRVDEMIDAWYDSGSMPFAQFHYPFEGEELFAERFPGRLHQRGDRPDPRLVLLAARDLDPGLRPHQLPQLRLPRA